VGGQPVELTQKEFALLRVLASAPTTVHTKDELLRTVWAFARAARTSGRWDMDSRPPAARSYWLARASDHTASSSGMLDTPRVCCSSYESVWRRDQARLASECEQVSGALP
jgi:hypothetical protein